MPAPQNPEITPAVFGTTSNVNLAAGTFTVTTLDGQTYDITLTAQTLVLYQGGTTELASSVLGDGLTVTVVGSPIGLPEQAKVRASIVIINRSESNQGYLEGNA